MENRVNVAHYVSELLFQHDCVVVPGFGGFVSTYAPARVHPAQHTFTPPSKLIVFNKHLQQNDGLLAQTIATEVPCPFEEAMSGITKFVEEVNNQLRTGKKVELHNLGTLSLDPEKNISFETFPEINYLIDSFGLASFQSMPVLRDAVPEKRKVIETVDRPVATEIVAAKPVRRRMRRVLVTSAIAVPVIAAALWFTTQNTNGLAGFGFFGKKEASKYQPVKWFVQPVVTDATYNELKADSNGIAEISLAANAPKIIVDIHKVVPDSTMVAVQQNWLHAPSHANDRFYVIAGCFGVQENAENFLHALKAKGYNPEVIDNVRSRLTHIGLASFKTKEEAAQFLSSINADVPGAWILKK